MKKIYIDCCIDGRQRWGDARAFSATLVEVRNHLENSGLFEVLPTLVNPSHHRDDFGNHGSEDVEMEKLVVEADIIICLCDPPSLGFSSVTIDHLIENPKKQCFAFVRPENSQYANAISPELEALHMYSDIGDIACSLPRLVEIRKTSNPFRLVQDLTVR